MCFGNIEACESILVDPQNKIMKTENEHNRSSLNTLEAKSSLGDNFFYFNPDRNPAQRI